MPCAAGDLCQLPIEELIAPNGHECGHECRGGCGGRLHGLCGEVEDGSDTPTHRICHTCISKRSPSNSAKRKEGQGFLQPDARKKKKTQESGSRKRLSFEEKLEIIKLLDSKVARPEVARRFGCGITAIASVKREKAALEAAVATNERSASSKSARGGDFPKVRACCVCACVGGCFFFCFHRAALSSFFLCGQCDALCSSTVQ